MPIKSARKRRAPSTASYTLVQSESKKKKKAPRTYVKPASPLDVNAMNGAVSALFQDFKKHAQISKKDSNESDKSALLQDDTRISLIFSLKLPPKNPRLKPKAM